MLQTLTISFRPTTHALQLLERLDLIEKGELPHPPTEEAAQLKQQALEAESALRSLHDLVDYLEQTATCDVDSSIPDSNVETVDIQLLESVTVRADSVEVLDDEFCDAVVEALEDLVERLAIRRSLVKTTFLADKRMLNADETTSALRAWQAASA